MSEEELNQELSTDELKDVAGGGIGPMGATGKVPLKQKRNSFSQGQTSFSELSDISRNVKTFGDGDGEHL